MATIGINGFGRIGRMCLRACLEKELEVRHLNDPFITTDYMVYLFKYDSTHGQYPEHVDCEGDALLIGERRISTSQEKDPSKIKWKDLGVTFVVEATGVFTTLEKASLHIDGGAKRVLITAPSIDAPMYVFGVNHRCYDPKKGHVVSAASCTTNCVAPIVKVIHDKFEVIEAMITSVHATTAAQKTVDGPTGKLWRDGRGCLQNIIPTSTGAAKSLGKIIPELKDKVSAIAFRVPVPNVSLCDITFSSFPFEHWDSWAYSRYYRSSRVNKPTTYDEIKRTVKEATESEFKDIMAYTEDDCVSSDFNHTTYSCIFDAKAVIPQTSTFIKVIAWYDNEYGYAHRIVDLLKYMDDPDSKNVHQVGEDEDDD